MVLMKDPKFTAIFKKFEDKQAYLEKLINDHIKNQTSFLTINNSAAKPQKNTDLI